MSIESKCPLFNETFTNIRNFLALSNEHFSKNSLSENKSDQFRDILLEYIDTIDDTISKTFGIKIEHHHGGYEGAGEEYWFIVSIIDPDSKKKRYFKIPCYYNSYDASDYNFDATFEVEPKEKMIIVYEKI